MRHRDRRPLSPSIAPKRWPESWQKEEGKKEKIDHENLSDHAFPSKSLSL
jgi:hypothetical protein